MDVLEIFNRILTRIVPTAGAFFVASLSYLFAFYNYEKAKDRAKAGLAMEGMTILCIVIFAFIGSMGLATVLYFGVLTVRVILQAGGV